MRVSKDRALDMLAKKGFKSIKSEQVEGKTSYIYFQSDKKEITILLVIPYGSQTVEVFSSHLFGND